MGIHEGPRVFRSKTEDSIVRAESNELNISDLVERSIGQAERFAEHNANQARVFISAGHRDMILEANNQLNAARVVAKNNPHFIPEIIEESDEQAAFLIALARVLHQPEYNQ
ncbi:hypothetical protein KC887_03060 [Candidatus Kaiserbacteria bacterium]|nr:hypothetical protein [Candidatus Kaiserbacteria bacterium]